MEPCLAKGGRPPSYCRLLLYLAKKCCCLEAHQYHQRALAGACRSRSLWLLSRGRVQCREGTRLPSPISSNLSPPTIFAATWSKRSQGEEGGSSPPQRKPTLTPKEVSSLFHEGFNKLEIRKSTLFREDFNKSKIKKRTFITK